MFIFLKECMQVIDNFQNGVGRATCFLRNFPLHDLWAISHHCRLEAHLGLWNLSVVGTIICGADSDGFVIELGMFAVVSQLELLTLAA